MLGLVQSPQECIWPIQIMCSNFGLEKDKSRAIETAESHEEGLFRFPTLVFETPSGT